ncbi:MAG TPA: hypothetical protein VE377_04880 [Candidatus Dormibacteraeota bacterium]|nr:hypothetical protein [Candidatus Dormibacteraeota bacterium]
MGPGSRWTKAGVALLLSCAFLCVPTVSFAGAETAQRQKKSKKQPPQLPPLPSGPTGRPVQQIPLDSIAAVPPQVTYQDNQLTIIAPNSTLGDILRAVRKQTGAEIEVPSAPERVVTRLGPGPARDVVAELLNGSRFNYVLLGSAGNDLALTRVVLVAKTGPQEVTPNPPVLDRALSPQAMSQEPESPPDANEADAADDNNNGDDNADQQAADAEQQQAPPQDQPGVKTPQQMLQEMQQRQLQLQQQQPPGQPPVPGAGMPPRPPQEN